MLPLAIIRLLNVLTGLTKPEGNYCVLVFNSSCSVSFSTGLVKKRQPKKKKSDEQ